MLPRFREHRLEIRDEPLRRTRLWQVFVNYSAFRGLDRRCERSCSVGDVFIDKAREGLRLMSQDGRLRQEEELTLPLRERLKRREQGGEVALLLSPYDGSGVLARRGEVAAVARTTDLDKSLGAAARRTDSLIQSRTRAACPTLRA